MCVTKGWWHPLRNAFRREVTGLAALMKVSNLWTLHYNSESYNIHLLWMMWQASITCRYELLLHAEAKLYLPLDGVKPLPSTTEGVFVCFLLSRRYRLKSYWNASNSTLKAWSIKGRLISALFPSVLTTWIPMYQIRTPLYVIRTSF